MILHFHFVLGLLKGLDGDNASSHKHTMANQTIEHIKWPSFQAEHSNLGISQIKGGGNLVQGAG